ncbi:MAG TPA: hypothetical protein VMX75_02495 [Spirochaetia bacterium]|nr:hypothetical protein [Spirochaetia bacterium]
MENGTIEGHARILSGLNPGDVVIVKGSAGLLEGTPVTVQDQG